MRWVLALFFSFNIFLFAQTVEWVAKYNGERDWDDEANGIALDKRGNVYITGCANQLPLTTLSDGLVIKYNSSGEEVWSRTYAPGSGGFYGVTVDEKGNVYVTGSVTIKYDSTGEIHWVADYPETVCLADIAVDEMGNVYVAGEVLIKYDSLGQEEWVLTKEDFGAYELYFPDIEYKNGYIYAAGYVHYPSPPYLDYLTIKWTPDGESVWTRRYNDPNEGDYDIIFDMAVDEGGNVYVTGEAGSGIGDRDCVTIKYNERGEMVWLARYSAISYLCGVGIAVSRNRDVYVAGYGFLIGYELFCLVIKYDSNGIEQWAERFDGEVSNRGIVVDNSDNVYVMGWSYDKRYIKKGCAWLVRRYGSSGEEQWLKVYGKDSTCNYPNAIAIDSLGNIYVTGGGDMIPYWPGRYYDCVTIKYSTYVWTKTRPMPEGERKKKVRDGASLTSAPEYNKIFAFKGNKTNEFYVFDIASQSWEARCSIPMGEEGKSVYKGASLTYGDGIVYAIKGNNTREFWAYFIEGDSWRRLKDVPLGTGKNIRQGGGIAYGKKGDSDFVYLLKGNGTNEFWVYWANQDSWLKRAEAPTLPSKKKYRSGSCIVYDGGNKIYLLKGITNEFYVYDMNRDVWEEKKPLPIFDRAGKKKRAKDGASMVCLDSTLYAFKGNNTVQFLAYLLEGDTWIEIESLPRGDRGKRIKGGGSLAAIGGRVYALKGNNTLEFWVYNPKQKGFINSLVLAEEEALSFNSVRVYPNPFSRKATIYYKLKSPAPITLELYDISGRLLWQKREEKGKGFGSILIDSESLSTGVYLLRFKGGNYQVTKKLVMSK